MGVRLALGAGPGDLVGMILRQVLGMTLAGLALGFAGSRFCTWVLASLLFGVKPTDPTTTFGVAALVVAIALVASFIPIRRATMLDPTTALRTE